jgi:hypothetical protein
MTYKIPDFRTSFRNQQTDGPIPMAWDSVLNELYRLGDRVNELDDAMKPKPQPKRSKKRASNVFIVVRGGSVFGTYASKEMAEERAKDLADYRVHTSSVRV